MPDDADRPDEADGPESTPPSAKASAASPPAAKSGPERPANAGEATPKPQPKRLFDRGLVWLGIVAVLVAVALGVSYLAEEAPKDPLQVAEAEPPPADIRSFCAAARAMSEAPLGVVDVGESAGQFRDYVDYLAALADEAPPSVAARIDRVQQSMQKVIAVMESPTGEGADAIQEVTDVLDEQGRVTAEDDAVISEYIARHCGFTPAEARAAAGTTSPVTAADEGAPTTETTAGGPISSTTAGG